MPAHPTRPRRPSRQETEQALSALDFPLDKEELVRCVADQTNEAGAAVVHQLRALPLASYASVGEVLRSIELADQHGP